MVFLMVFLNMRDIYLRYLSLVLARFLLILVHLFVLALLLGVVDEEVAELLVDLLPQLVLRVGYHRAGLGRAGHLPAQAGDVVRLQESLVELLSRKEVTLVVREQGHVVLQDRKHYVPQVECLAHQLEGLGLYANLWRDSSYGLQKHS